MKKKEELFYLIKSLTKSEKRHFKLFVHNTSSPNIYMALFEEIARQQVYDEDMIREKFNGEVFVRQLTTTKNYLRNLILKSLRVYYSDLSKESVARDALRNAEILYHKGLYQMSLFEINKADDIAGDYDLFSIQFEAQTWKRRIMQAENPQQEKELNEVSQNQLRVVGNLSSYARMWNLNIQPEVGANENIEISDDEPLQIRLYKKLYHFQKLVRNGHPDDAVGHLQDVINEYDENPCRKKEEAETYLVLMNNLLALYVFQRKYEKAIPLVQTVKSFILNQKNESAPIFKTLLRTLNIELEIYRESKDITKGLSLVEEIDEHLSQSRLPVPETYRLSFWFQFANLFFEARKYNDSLKWVNILLDNRNNKKRVDLITYAHWLNLMIHFELKNFFVLRYFVDSTRRFLKKRKKIEKYENELLRMFSKVADVPSQDLKNFFSQYFNRMQTADFNVPDSVIDYIDFNAWLKKNTASFS